MRLKILFPICLWERNLEKNLEFAVKEINLKRWLSRKGSEGYYYNVYRKELYIIINTCLMKGLFPDELKLAISSILKNDKQRVI